MRSLEYNANEEIHFLSKIQTLQILIFWTFCSNSQNSVHCELQRFSFTIFPQKFREIIAIVRTYCTTVNCFHEKFFSDESKAMTLTSTFKLDF